MNNAKVITYTYSLLDSIVTFDEGLWCKYSGFIPRSKANLILEIPSKSHSSWNDHSSKYFETQFTETGIDLGSFF